MTNIYEFGSAIIQGTENEQVIFIKTMFDNYKELDEVRYVIKDGEFETDMLDENVILRTAFLHDNEAIWEFLNDFLYEEIPDRTLLFWNTDDEDYDQVCNLYNYNRYMERRIMRNEDCSLMPNYIVIIRDLEGLMGIDVGESDEVISRLGQLGKDSGIHLVIAIDDLSGEVITDTMKKYIPIIDLSKDD